MMRGWSSSGKTTFQAEAEAALAAKQAAAQEAEAEQAATYRPTRGCGSRLCSYLGLDRCPRFRSSSRLCPSARVRCRDRCRGSYEGVEFYFFHIRFERSIRYRAGHSEYDQNVQTETPNPTAAEPTCTGVFQLVQTLVPRGNAINFQTRE